MATNKDKNTTNWFGKALFYWMYLFQVVILIMYIAAFIGMKRLLREIRVIAQESTQNTNQTESAQ